MPTNRSRGPLVGWLVAIVVTGLVLGAAAWGAATLYYAANREPAPWDSSCSATVNDTTVRIDPEQARNAAIIAGVAGRRGLPPRAVSIGLATAMQESGLRNLSYGDRDSLGLFQQRPSQGWGTAAQVKDPWYASNAFFAEMEKMDGWRTADIGDIAQKVQRSGFPDAYDKHVPDARVLASALSGETPAAFTCSLVSPPAGDAPGLKTFLTKSLTRDATVTASGGTVTVKAPSARAAWSAAAIAIADSGTHGVAALGVANRTWTLGRPSDTPWTTAQTEGATSTTVVITVRS